MSTHDTPAVTAERPAATLLARLEGVRMKNAGRWVARCPAHDDVGPSLAVTERDDGAVLLHCFGGCSVGEVVGARGLELSDLYPQTGETRRPERRAFDPAQRLACIAHEVTVVVMIVKRAAEQGDVNDEDRARLRQAYRRIADAVR